MENTREIIKQALKENPTLLEEIQREIAYEKKIEELEAKVAELERELRSRSTRYGKEVAKLKSKLRKYEKEDVESPQEPTLQPEAETENESDGDITEAKILEIISSQTEGITFEEILKIAETEDTKNVLQAIENLINSGQIYEPRINTFKIIKNG